MKKVVVIIPVYKLIPNELEKKSFLNCLKILGAHPICIVAPENLDLSFYSSFAPNLRIIRFKPFFFESINGYNRLMLSKEFYSSFKEFEFMLIHQLDAFVFRDDLINWCNRDYDYVGAPVFNVQPDIHSRIIDFVTLNGGLSLRKTQTALKVLNSFHSIYPLKSLVYSNWKEHKLKGLLLSVYFYLFGNNTFYKLNKYDRNEDIFWAIICTKKVKGYNVPPVEISIQFAIDNHPEKAFEFAKSQLPFGCHGFDKHISFWKEYLTL